MEREGGLSEIAHLPHMHLSPVQNEVKRLYSQLIKKKTALQQSLNEISGQSISKQLQVNLTSESLGYQAVCPKHTWLASVSDL